MPVQDLPAPYALVMAAPSRNAYFAAVKVFGEIALAHGASPPEVLSPWRAAQWTLTQTSEDLHEQLSVAGDYLSVDWTFAPREARRKSLLIADMDSTIITVECIDELADFIGRKAEIAAITESAMRGDIDFETALTQRVAMLKGLPLADLDRCYEQRVRLSEGADVLVATMRAHGARCVLASGGFTFFTSRVAALAGFHAHRANRLEDNGAALSGTVALPIMGQQAKLETLKAQATKMGVPLDACLAIGDGANDLAMITAAGLGIAYRAKPVVQAQAKAAIQHTDLTTALYFQGYAKRDFAEPAQSDPVAL